MDFFTDGSLLVTASTDGTVSLYDTMAGVEKKHLFCRKYGVNLVKFTHHPESILHTSANNSEDSIRYLSLYDNSYMRYYTGHTDKVVSMAVSPTDDRFVSIAMDHTMRLWSIQTAKCQGILRYPAAQRANHVQFDPDGLVLALSFPGNVIKLYDYRKLDQGPFTEGVISEREAFEITGLTFSPDGNYIAVSTQQGTVVLLDASNLKPIRTYPAHKNEHLTLEATFSADSRYLFSGTEDGTIKAWGVSGGEEVATFENVHSGPVKCLRWCPHHSMLASTCSNLVFWLPDRSKAGTQQPLVNE